MQPIYISVGILILLIVAGFGLMRWQQQQAVTAAYATPTPAPGPTVKPLAFADGDALGKPFFTANPPDTAQGGRGNDVDGISCSAQEFVTLHVHSHLAIFYNGKQLQVPQFIGAAQSPAGECLYWVHTHHPDGIIHVEAPQLNPPQGGDFTLGIFFDIWGQPLTRDNVAGLKGPVVAYINGTKYDGDLRAIPLKSHQQIVLEIGSPTVTPPNYEFPPAD